MRRFMMVLLLIVVAPLTLAGCGIMGETVDAEFAQRMDENLDLFQPRYEAYMEADTTLNEEDKAAQRAALKSWRDMITAAKTKAGG